jgi:hypothetical protein
VARTLRTIRTILTENNERTIGTLVARRLQFAEAQGRTLTPASTLRSTRHAFNEEVAYARTRKQGLRDDRARRRSAESDDDDGFDDYDDEYDDDDDYDFGNNQNPRRPTADILAEKKQIMARLKNKNVRVRLKPTQKRRTSIEYDIVAVSPKKSTVIGNAFVTTMSERVKRKSVPIAYVNSITLGSHGIHPAFERVLGSKRMLELAKDYAINHDLKSHVAKGFRVGGARSENTGENKGLNLQRVRTKAWAEAHKQRNASAITKKGWATRKRKLR